LVSEDAKDGVDPTAQRHIQRGGKKQEEGIEEDKSI